MKVAPSLDTGTKHCALALSTEHQALSTGDPLSLFDPVLPNGFIYRADFLSTDEERDLARTIDEISFDTFTMRGVTARRRVKFYGATYGDIKAGPLPEFLSTLRAHLGEWIGVPPDAFVMALINEYTPGATIGWHRDAPQYGVTAGVSLLSTCRMRLRPYVSPADLAASPRTRKTSHELTLAPRSAYLISGAARDAYEHSIPATEAVRYSITFRTSRRDSADLGG